MENKTKIIHHTKWCIVCGRSVDLRKKDAYQISEQFKPCPNPEYHYICGTECKHKFRQGIGLER